MAGKFRIEPRNHSRELVEQINKQFDAIEASLKPAFTPTPAATPAPSSSSNVNVTSGIAGTGVNQGLNTDGVTMQGNGVDQPLAVADSIASGAAFGGSLGVVPLAFGFSPYSAVLSSAQAKLFMCSADPGADFILNLPPAVGSGNVAVVEKADANAHNIAVTPNGTDTINGVNAPVNLASQFNTVRLVDVIAGQWVEF